MALHVAILCNELLFWLQLVYCVGHLPRYDTSMSNSMVRVFRPPAPGTTKFCQARHGPCRSRYLSGQFWQQSLQTLSARHGENMLMEQKERPLILESLRALAFHFMLCVCISQHCCTCTCHYLRELAAVSNLARVIRAQVAPHGSTTSNAPRTNSCHRFLYSTLL